MKNLFKNLLLTASLLALVGAMLAPPVAALCSTCTTSAGVLICGASSSSYRICAMFICEGQHPSGSGPVLPRLFCCQDLGSCEY